MSSCLQAAINKLPDGFGARRLWVLLGPPCIETGEVVGLKTHTNKRPLAGGRWTTLFLCYHGLTFHDIRVITETSRGEACTFSSALTPADGVTHGPSYPKEYHETCRRGEPV